MAWTTNNEFVCRVCGVMIGKNLNGESPFLLGKQHMDIHTEEEKLRANSNPSQTYIDHFDNGKLLLL